MWEFLETKLFWVTVVFAAFYIYLRCCVYNYWKRHGIPHETPSIPLGNIPISYLFGKMSLGKLIRNSYEKYNQHPFHGMYIFHRPVIVINDPELTRIILVKEFSKFCDRGWFMNEKVDSMSANIFLQPHDKWRRLRSKFTPTFTPSKLRQIYPLMAEIGDEMIKACDAELKVSDVVEIKDMIARYTTDIISSTVYGFNCNSLKDPNNAFRRFGVKAFEFGRINMLIAVFLPEILESINMPFYHKVVRNFFADIFNGTLNYRRQENIVRNDFMNLLMQLMDKGMLEDDELSAEIDEKSQENDRLSLADAAAQAFVFFLGGFETSSSTATYCLLELAMNPDIQVKLQEEIDKVAESQDGFTYDSIAEMEYLDMVISETLRKYTVVDFLNRLCVEDFAIPNSNYVIKKGMRVLFSPPGVHRNPKFYPNPSRFDPSRFTKENVASRSSYVNLAFGEGPRNCIGKKYGVLQAKQAIAVLLHNYNFRISDETELPITFDTETFVQAPAHHVNLRLEKRRRTII